MITQILIQSHKVSSRNKTKRVNIAQTGRFMALWQAWEAAMASQEAQACALGRAS